MFCRRRIASRRAAVAALAVGLGLAAGLPPAASAAITSPTTVFLDTFESVNDGAAGPVATADVLAPGQFYGVEVSGTFSTFNEEIWNRRTSYFGICGIAATDAALPSPGRPATPAGQDAEIVFARPWFFPCRTTPYRYRSFQMDTGSGFGHPGANGVSSATPDPSHTYVYLVRGEGQVARFQQMDTQTRDNYGVLSITVRPATASDCAGNAECLGAAVPASAASTAAVPTVQSRTCVSRRRFRIRVVSRRRDPVVAATVRVNNKRVRVRRLRIRGVSRLTASVDLRRLPRNRFSVLITARRRSGKVVAGKRTYRTCTKKRPGGRPRL
jgi:hypothetical protein